MVVIWDQDFDWYYFRSFSMIALKWWRLLNVREREFSRFHYYVSQKLKLKLEKKFPSAGSTSIRKVKRKKKKKKTEFCVVLQLSFDLIASICWRNVNLMPCFMSSHHRQHHHNQQSSSSDAKREHRLNRRREQNRLSAQRSRQRQRDLTNNYLQVG